MGVEKTVPRKAINKKTKKSIVFDENKRKEFLTGFKKRKDERRKKWNEKVERDLKNEIKKIKEETKSKVSFIHTATDTGIIYLLSRWRKVLGTRAIRSVQKLPI